MRIEATFVTSAANGSDLPRDGLAEVALIGRSNVGKSSLINALVRQKVARTSSTPGKTRLANIYRVSKGSSGPFYLVDLPGYGHARGDVNELAAIARAYFGRVGRVSQVGRVGKNTELLRDPPDLLDPPDLRARVSALLLVDARHPGLQSDTEAWNWLQHSVGRCAVVATKIDKLARGERIRAMRELQSVFDDPVLPVSAVTGEGLDELWILINRLANLDNPSNPVNSRPRNSSHRRPSSRAATAPRALRTRPRPRR